MPKKRLADLQKRHVVMGLACFRSQHEMMKEVKESFGMELSLPAIQHYDPTTSMGSDLAADLKDLFFKSRTQYLSRVDGVEVAHLAGRMHRYQRVVERAEARGNLPLVLEALQGAAKDMGGMFTNKRELTIDPLEALARLLGVKVEDLPPPGEFKLGN